MPDRPDISAIISRLNEVNCHEAADMRDLVLDLALFIERQSGPAVLTEVLSTEPERKPVCVYGEPGTTVVVCDDGSKWGETRNGGHEQELPPIPGTRRARELSEEATS